MLIVLYFSSLLKIDLETLDKLRTMIKEKLADDVRNQGTSKALPMEARNFLEADYSRTICETNDRMKWIAVFNDGGDVEAYKEAAKTPARDSLHDRKYRYWYC